MKTFQNEMVLSSASSCLGKNNDQLMYIILNKLACRESLYWRKSISVILKFLGPFFSLDGQKASFLLAGHCGFLCNALNKNLFLEWGYP